MEKGRCRTKVLVGQLLPAKVAASAASPDADPAPLVFEAPTLFKLDPLTPNLGAEVLELDYSKAVARDPEVIRQIHEAFTRYKVLMFRKTGLDRQGHKASALCLPYRLFEKVTSAFWVVATYPGKPG